ncbi:MAG: ATP-dependent sacrificial sulfur transferase LarE, partial [Bacteroidota bacterium]
MNIEEKYRKLEQILRDMNKVVVAYSGGVDSSFLLKVACNVLKENSMGVMAISPSFPSREYEKAISFAKNIGAKLEIIETDELDDTNYTSNPVNRCYFCKNELFNKITSLAGTRGYENLVDGSNQDDLNDHRPGKKALEEKKVRSPLQEAGLTKSDIRHLSQSLGLSTWNKEE